MKWLQKFVRAEIIDFFIMKVQRNISSAFIFISAFVAVAYSAAYFSEDELMNQIREDLLLAKLFNRMQAREQGMTRSRSVSLPPYSSPPFNPFLPGRSNTGKVSQQREPSTGSIFVSPREAWLQEKALKQFFSKKLVDPNKDWRASKLHKRVKMATTVEGRIQDYIKILNKTKVNEQAQKLMDDFFTCSIKSLPDFIESSFLKGTRIFGIPTSRLLAGYKTLIGRSSNGLNFFKAFVNLVSYVLDQDELVAKEQVFNFTLFRKLRNISEGGFKSFVDIPIQKGENETFRNFLNIASGFLSSRNLTAEGKIRFKRSISYFVERFLFKQIDSMDMSERDKTAMKKIVKGAVNIVVAAIFRMWNNEGQNLDNRTSELHSVITILSSIITVIESLNNESDDTPILEFAISFLARNPTKEELTNTSYCLILAFLRKSLDYVVFILERDQHQAKGAGPMECGITFMIDGFHLFLDYIPTRVSNVEGCEDFAAIGYRGMAQLRSEDAIDPSR